MKEPTSELTGVALSADSTAARQLAGTFKALAEKDAIDPGTAIVVDDRYPLGIRRAFELEAQRLMKPNRSGIFWVSDSPELATALRNCKAGEVVIELSAKPEVSVGSTHRYQVDVGHGSRVCDETKEIGDDFLLVPDDEGTVSEFVDEHGVMQGPITVVTPEIRQFRHDLIIVVLRAARDVHVRLTPPSMTASTQCSAVGCKPS
jgi:hypothetical protein